MGDDRPVEPFFDIGLPFEKPFWGLRERRAGRMAAPTSGMPRSRARPISPWADRANMAAALGSRCIFSIKPNLVDLVMEGFDPDRIRASLRRDLEITRGAGSRWS